MPLPESPVPAGSPPAAGRSSELLEHYKRGDADALEELFARYYPRLHRLAQKRMRPSQREHAASMDVVQGTFLVALGKLADFEFSTPSALLRYLSAILDNQLRDLSKRTAARPRALPIEADQGSRDGPAVQPASTEPAPYDALSEQEFLEIRARVVASLEPEARDVLLLREVGGGSWEEIAQELGAPSAHAAEQRYQRARNRRDLLLMRRVRF